MKPSVLTLSVGRDSISCFRFISPKKETERKKDKLFSVHFCEKRHKERKTNCFLLISPKKERQTERQAGRWRERQKEAEKQTNYNAAFFVLLEVMQKVFGNQKEREGGEREREREREREKMQTKRKE